MSLTINLPAAIEKDVLSYTTLEGTTLEQMFIVYLKKEIERSRERRRVADADEWEARFDELVTKSSAGMKGTEPYEFNRADAYPDGTFA